MANTIFYKLKLKRTKTQTELFEKMKCCVKGKGATKKWTCVIKDEIMTIDFGDNKSEAFVISFDKNVCQNSCKVFFPLEGELFDNEKQSEFKSLLNMIYSARAFFSEIDITDDYGLAVDFMESKKYKIVLRELSEDEAQQLRKLYDAGYKKHPDLIIAYIYEKLGIPDGADFHEYINEKTVSSSSQARGEEMLPLFETYIYDTSIYKKRGRVDQIPEYEYRDLGDVGFSTAAFMLIADELYRFKDYFKRDSSGSFGVKHAQLRRYYKDKVYPKLVASDDDFEKCKLAYRFFLSAYDFCGFSFVGRE